jgi:transposase
MYLRHTTVNKGGKVHTYWRLVRSVRQGRKVKQQVVAHLGELDAVGHAQAAALARQIMGKADQGDLFDSPKAAAEVVPVRVDQVRTERARRFGDVWLGLKLWQALGLDEFCRENMPPGREGVSWATMAAVLVVARLCEPSSELHIAEDWYRKSALEDLLGVRSDQVNDDRLYRALDRLLLHRDALQVHLKNRLGQLFSLDYDLMLYDVTSTYFEGQAQGNAMAKRGYSRDHRADCKQVCIALVVSREGMPIGYEVFDGNRVDVTTVEQIVDTMEGRYGKAGRVWVMDRGMSSASNIHWLQRTERRYLIGANKQELKKFERELIDARDWMQVRADVEAKLCSGPTGTETFVIVRSAERREKERAMHERFTQRIVEGLQRLQGRIEKSNKPLDRGVLERQIGRLLGKNSRAAGKFTVRLINDKRARAKLRLQYSERAEWDDWAQHSEGCYLLRTNVHDWTPDELWRTYIQLTDAEAAFRIYKSELSIRPVWHQMTERVLAHIFVCFLAYVMWKTLEQWQKRAGLGNSPRTILEELRAIQSTDVVLPVASDPQRELRIRCVVRPDSAACHLLDRLGLRLPDRVRLALSAHGM